jgi:hypothetical protein
VEQQRNEDAEDLDKNEIRHIVQVLNVLIEDAFAAESRRVRVHVDEKENTERHNAGQLVQLSQKECITDLNGHQTKQNRTLTFS